MGEIRICGLGVDPREDATVEALLALESCRVVFTDIADAGAVAWLKPFCRDLRKAAGAAGIAAAARSSGAVGLAVWGHPQSTSVLAREVQALACRMKIPYRVFAGMSPMGGVLCRSVLFLGGMEGMNGMRSCSLAEFFKHPDIVADGMPLVVFAETASKADWTEFARLLRAHYPGGHVVSVHPLANREASRVRLEDLAAEGPGGALIYVPVKD